MKFLQRYNLAIGALLAVLVLFVGFRLDLPEGWARGGVVLAAAVAFFLCAWVLKAKPPTTLNSVGPLLFLVHFHLSGWWLLAGIILLVWLWAASRESGRFGIAGGLAVLGALVFTVACVVGVGFGWLLK